MGLCEPMLLVIPARIRFTPHHAGSNSFLPFDRAGKIQSSGRPWRVVSVHSLNSAATKRDKGLNSLEAAVLQVSDNTLDN
jgi:hypothetical protein